MDHAHPVYDEITRLLASPAQGAGAPPLEHLEETLTTGYARALALEAERLRIERRIGEMAVQLQDGPERTATDEIAALSAQLTRADGELTRLRGLLETLRVRASGVRLADAPGN
jgi:hypothetical protein